MTVEAEQPSAYSCPSQRGDSGKEGSRAKWAPSCSGDGKGDPHQFLQNREVWSWCKAGRVGGGLGGTATYGFCTPSCCRAHSCTGRSWHSRPRSGA